MTEVYLLKNGMKLACKKIERIYRDAGVPENCALVIGEGYHYNYADLIWNQLGKM